MGADGADRDAGKWIEAMSIDELHVAAVPADITPLQAYAALTSLMPEFEIRIEYLKDGRVRLWRDQTKMSVRPSLREIVGRAEWYYCCSFQRPCPLRAKAA